MLTVTISINREVIYCRSVINRIEETGHYICDDGTKIKHRSDQGSVRLAIKVLKTIKEIK